MGAIKSANINNTEYTVSYTLGGGIDSSATIGVSRDRVAYCENMYRDYEGNSGLALESIPGYRKLSSFGKKINAIHTQSLGDGEIRMIIHSGDKLHWRTYSNSALWGNSDFATVPDKKSVSFNLVDSLYILDKENIHRLKREGEYTSTNDNTLTPYIPTVSVNGVEYEGRNILTDSFIEELSLSTLDEYSFGSPGIIYAVTDGENKLCKTVGLSDTQTAYNIYVPSYTVIDGVRYKVTEIGEDSFRGRFTIKTITIGEGVHTIGDGAFCDCTALVSVYMPKSLATIKDNAFLRCLKLENLYFGISLTTLSENAFLQTPTAKNIYYGGKESDFFKIAGTGYIATTYTFTPYYKKNDIYISLPIKNKAKKVTRVSIGGINRSFEYAGVNGAISDLNVNILDKESAEFTTAKIYCEYYDPWQKPLGIDYEDGKSLIAEASIVAEFDGRIFLSGFPLARGFVFYNSIATSEDELYFPLYNYFKEGNSATVTSILPARNALLVFTNSDKDGGAIYYHEGRDSGVDIVSRIYPVSYIHTGVAALGASISFYDDPVFLTRGGLFGIEMSKISLDRSLVCRSHNINSNLLSEELSSAMMTVWCGYLMIFTGTRVYLADSRARFHHPTGGYEYEWYMLSGIGTYTGMKRKVYRYSDTEGSETKVHKDKGKITDKVVITTIDKDGEIYYYTEEGGVRYGVYPTGMVVCDTLVPPTALVSLDESKLIFGTESGDIYTFNNDKRGVPPYEVEKSEDFDINEYRKHYARLIHPHFYTFDGITPRYAVKLPIDDCNIPYFTKSTVNNSLTLKCTYRGRGEIITEVATDKDGYREVSAVTGGGFDFSDISFDSLSLTTDDLLTIPVMERERGWIEKQIAIYSMGYASPIAIHSVSFRYKIKGKIKKK